MVRIGGWVQVEETRGFIGSGLSICAEIESRVEVSEVRLQGGELEEGAAFRREVWIEGRSEVLEHSRHTS